MINRHKFLVEDIHQIIKPPLDNNKQSF